MNRLFVCDWHEGGSIYSFGTGTDSITGSCCFSRYHASWIYCQHLKSGDVTRQRWFLEGTQFTNVFLISDSRKQEHISLDQEKLVPFPRFINLSAITPFLSLIFLKPLDFPVTVPYRIMKNCFLNFSHLGMYIVTCTNVQLIRMALVFPAAQWD